LVKIKVSRNKNRFTFFVFKRGSRLKKLFQKIRGYIKELGNLTPIAFLTTVLPIIGGWSLALFFAIPLGNWLKANWEIGIGVYFLFVLFFCGLALLPTNVIGIIAGWAFGFEIGITVLILAVVSASTLSFLIHSRLVGDTLPHVFENHPKGKVIYEALVEQNFWRTTLIIFLLRLSPAMPFALTNFLMASARVPLKAFGIGTFCGMLPRSVAVVLVGAGLSELSLSNPQEMWLIIFGIIATIISIIFITIVARRALERLTREKQTA
jgi:uncharacterized membrane protein YdjX (TVP38/TMEM64 family)